jgi:hypothetical protein
MLVNKKSWCVVTYHKDNYSLLKAFTVFYRSYYGIQNMLIFCGLTQGRTHESLKHFIATKLKMSEPAENKKYQTLENRELTMSKLMDGDFTLWVVTYPTEKYGSDAEFHKLRVDLSRWGESFLPENITRTIVVDADEFLRVRNPKILESMDSLGFHFLDIVPSQTWPPKELIFSLQGWYYQRQARPLFKYFKGLALPLVKALGFGLQHGGCKTFYFDRERMSNWTSWHHGTTHSFSCCMTLNRYIYDPKTCQKILENTACCYHLGMTHKEIFLKEKLGLFNRLQTDLKKGTELDKHRGAESSDLYLAGKIFDKTIKKSIFPLIKDNFLLPYLTNS